MQIVKPRKHLRRALALLLVWLCGLLFAAHAHAAEPQAVTVDFVTSTDYTKSSEDIVAAQKGYLYFNEKTTNNGRGRANEWIEFPISGLAAGSYKVSIVYKTHTENGVFQTYIDGTEVGTPVNGQGSTAEHTADLGTVTITESDVHTVKLMALQNDYGKYRITVKSLTLTPVEPDEGSGEGSGNGSDEGSGNGSGSGSGEGSGNGSGDGSGNGSGEGSGNGSDEGSGNGSGEGSGSGSGEGSGNGSGNGSDEGSGNGTETPAPAVATEVTVDFTTSQQFSHSEGASPSAGDYLYFNQGGENGAWVTFPWRASWRGRNTRSRWCIRSIPATARSGPTLTIRRSVT